MVWLISWESPSTTGSIKFTFLHLSLFRSQSPPKKPNPVITVLKKKIYCQAQAQLSDLKLENFQAQGRVISQPSTPLQTSNLREDPAWYRGCIWLKIEIVVVFGWNLRICLTRAWDWWWTPNMLSIILKGASEYFTCMPGTEGRSHREHIGMWGGGKESWSPFPSCDRAFTAS